MRAAMDERDDADDAPQQGVRDFLLRGRVDEDHHGRLNRAADHSRDNRDCERVREREEPIRRGVRNPEQEGGACLLPDANAGEQDPCAAAAR